MLDETWEWMKFLQGDEWLEIDTRATGQQVGRKSFQEKWVRLLKEANPGLADKNLKPFMDAIAQNYARPIELFKKHSEAALIMNKAMHDSIRDGKATSKQPPAKPAGRLTPCTAESQPSRCLHPLLGDAASPAASPRLDQLWRSRSPCPAM